MTTQVPTIETERLRLRGHTAEDFQACAEMWADPNVVRYIGGQPASASQSWSRLLNYAGHWALMGFGYWAVEEKASGYFIGELGFADFKRELEPPITGIPELGWALASRAHGKGLATEALRAVLSWGDNHFGRVETVCLIQPENIASIRIADKIGFKEARRTLYRNSPLIVFNRLNGSDLE